MRLKLFFSSLYLLCVSTVVWGAGVSYTAVAPHVGLELFFDHDVVTPNTSLRSAIKFKVQQGWHLYWRNSGDSGEPPKAEWILPPGWTAGTFQWPVPERIPVGPLVNFGFENELFLATPIIVGDRAGTTGQEVTVVAQVSWLVCQESCIPGKATLTRNVLWGNKQILSEQAPEFAKAEQLLPQRWDDAALTAKTQGGEVHISIPRAARKAEYFPIDSGYLENAAPQVLEADANNAEAMMLKIKVSEIADRAPRSLEGVLVLDNVGYEVSIKLKSQTASIAYDEDGTDSEVNAASKSASSLWATVQAIILAFMGGLVLNLMPCVFPVLSIKALTLLQSSDKSEKHKKAHALAYGAGVVGTFWFLFLLLAALRSGGSAVGWGFQLQSPVFVALLSALFFALALNLLGVFEIGLGFMGRGAKLTEKSGYTGDVLTGVLAVVAATPCTAPFMGTALGFAATQSVAVGFAVFTFLGLGLACPYVLINYIPVLAKLLPKPGRWMETVKQFLAFPLFATSAWLVWVLGVQRGVDIGFKITLMLICFAVCLWGYGRARTQKWRVITLMGSALSILLILYTAMNAAALPTASVSSEQQDSSTWVTFSKQGLENLLSEKRAVFIDFTAAWCVSCKVNEMVALTPDVLKQLSNAGVVLVKADWTNENPEITEALRSFGRDGVPLYVYYAAGGDQQNPQILPQVLTKGIVLDLIK